MRVTIGHATQAMTTPMTVELRVIGELEVRVALRGGKDGRSDGDQHGVGGQR